MGLVTILSIAYLMLQQKKIPLKQIIIYSLAVLILDFGYLMDLKLVMHASNTGSGHDAGIFHFGGMDTSNIVFGLNIVLLLLTLLAWKLPEKNLYTKSIVVATGVATFIVQYADIFIIPELQFSHHFNYVIHPVIALILWYDTIKLMQFLIKKEVYRNYFYIITTCLMLITGFFIARSHALNKLPEYKKFSEVYSILKQISPSDKDLIIAPSVYMDDIAAWLPLAFKSQVLFSRDSENLLPNSKEGHDIYWDREAIYLFLTGIDSNKLHTILFESNNDVNIERIIIYDQRFKLKTKNRFDYLQHIYNILSVRLDKMGNDPHFLKKFFRNYSRVFIIDNAKTSIFLQEKIPLHIKNILKRNNIQIKVYENNFSKLIKP
jgi:hypothetical protein